MQGMGVSGGVILTVYGQAAHDALVYIGNGVAGQAAYLRIPLGWYGIQWSHEMVGE